MNWEWLDQRPIIVAIAGPNGSGKTTFYRAHIEASGMKFINADLLAAELHIDAYAAAALSSELRKELVRQKESFAFETVLSDPVGEKIDFLRSAVNAGYNVALCFVGLSSWEISEQRVAMRVTQGGHDVPTNKLEERYPRSLNNLRKAVEQLPRVLVFDNSDLSNPYAPIAFSQNGTLIFKAEPLPRWFREIF